MTLLLANWELILLVLLAIIFIVFKVKQFLTTPSEKRQELMLVWLVQAVEFAERRYGGKTGSLKLSYVYKMFVDKYGLLGMFVSQEVFEKLVNKALVIMENTFKESKKHKQSK